MNGFLKDLAAPMEGAALSLMKAISGTKCFMSFQDESVWRKFPVR